LFESDSSGFINSISFSSSGRFAVIHAENEKGCSLWGIRNGIKTDISLDTSPVLVSFSSDGSRLVIVENGKAGADIRVLTTFSPEAAMDYAKQLLEDTGLTWDEKIRYFAAGEGSVTDTPEIGNSTPKPNPELAGRLDDLVGTYSGYCSIGDGEKKIILRLYKTSPDSLEGDLSLLNAKGAVGWECLMKVQRSTVDDRIHMYTYRSIREESGIDFPDFLGSLSGRVMSGRTMVNYEANGVFRVNKDSTGTAENTGMGAIPDGRVPAGPEAGKDAADAYSENGFRNMNVWKQGNRIYYTKSSGIYARDIGGKSAEEKLCDDDPYMLVLSGNWLYFTSCDGLLKVRTDGSYRQKLDGSDAREIFVDGEWIYYTDTDDGDLGYKIKTDGRDQKVSGYWVYYRNGDDGYSLYRIKKDGTGDVKLNDINSCDLNVAEDRIAFYSIVYGRPNALYSMNKDGSDLRRIADDVTYCVDVRGDWAYYTNAGDGYTPYRVKLDGSGRMKLSDDYCDELDICGDWVYFFNDSELYRVKVDGSIREPA
jgi:hypothetical protein